MRLDGSLEEGAKVGRTPIRGLAEIALRVRDLAAMRAF